MFKFILNRTILTRGVVLTTSLYLHNHVLNRTKYQMSHVDESPSHLTPLQLSKFLSSMIHKFHGQYLDENE